jgi:pimeloyl-ACP methyl ester carboxylesterase
MVHNGAGSRHLFPAAVAEGKQRAFRLIGYSPWGFDLAGIQAPVSLRHGMQDFVPVAHARWLADRIPNVTGHFPVGEDHTNVEKTNRAAAFAWLSAQQS